MEPEGSPVDMDVFEREYAEHLDAGTLEETLEQLLAAYPTASVAAVRSDNVIVPMPTSIPLKDHVLVDGRAALDLLAYDENLMEAWDRVRETGAGRARVHLSGRPDIAGMIHMLDLRERHGVIMSITTLEIPEGIDIDAVRAEVADTKPRSASTGKSETSVILKVDEAFTKILGWSAEEIVGRRSLEFIHPDDHARAIDNWVAMFATPGPGRRVRLRHLHRDGAWVWMELTNHNLLADPEHGCVATEMVDISEEMAAHEEVRARQQLLDRLAGAMPVGLLQLDVERRVVYTNERLHEIVGVERTETAATQLAGVIDDDRPILERSLASVLRDGTEADVEVQLCVGPSADLRICTISLRALTLDDGTISGAIACVTDVTDGARMREELQRRATFDELTGCYNRSSIMLTLEANIDSGRRRAERAVAFVDVDSFKEINDRYGHAVGDELLRLVAQRLRGAVREADLVGRIGGDEFLVVCPDIGGPDLAMQLAERLSAAVRDVSLDVIPGGIDVQVSVGVAWSCGSALSADALVARADAAMYASKREGAGEPKLAHAA